MRLAPESKQVSRGLRRVEDGYSRGKLDFDGRVPMIGGLDLQERWQGSNPFELASPLVK
jgi:hypothetical protein